MIDVSQRITRGQADGILMAVGTVFEVMQKPVIPPGKWYSDPNLAEAYFHMENDHFEQAVVAFQRYLRDPLLGPGETVSANQSYLLVDMAYCLDKAKRPEEVVKTLKTLPKPSLTKPKAAYLLGCALAALGHKKEAISTLGQAKPETEDGRYHEDCMRMATWIRFME
ncbi:MAG: CDC27 family protein [Candidatus Peribacteraceae bacterium]